MTIELRGGHGVVQSYRILLHLALVRKKVIRNVYEYEGTDFGGIVKCDHKLKKYKANFAVRIA